MERTKLSAANLVFDFKCARESLSKINIREEFVGTNETSGMFLRPGFIDVCY